MYRASLLSVENSYNREKNLPLCHSHAGGRNGTAYLNNIEQSITGNVYGIYDVSGGANEYIAGYVNNGNSSLTTYGLSLNNGTINFKLPIIKEVAIVINKIMKKIRHIMEMLPMKLQKMVIFIVTMVSAQFSLYLNDQNIMMYFD